MSVNIKRNGTLQKIADQTLIFDANVSEVRTGTLSTTTTTIPSQDYITLNITFSTPMPDNNYCVVFQDNEIAFETYTVTGKTKNGFNVIVGNTRNIEQRYNFTYYAFKLIELEGYTALYNKVNNAVDSSPTQNSTNFVTSGGVYEAIENSASSFIGTQEEWEELTSAEQSQYEIVYITDDEAADGYFTPTTISTTGVTVSQGAATIDSLNCVRSGNIVTISGALDAASLTNGSGTTTKLTLPNTVPAAMILTTGAMGYWGNGVDETGYCQINGRTLTFFSNADNSSVSGMYVRFSITYICQ